MVGLGAFDLPSLQSFEFCEVCSVECVACLPFLGEETEARLCVMDEKKVSVVSFSVWIIQFWICFRFAARLSGGTGFLRMFSNWVTNERQGTEITRSV